MNALGMRAPSAPVVVSTGAPRRHQLPEKAPQRRFGQTGIARSRGAGWGVVVVVVVVVGGGGGSGIVVVVGGEEEGVIGIENVDRPRLLGGKRREKKI